MRNIIAFTTRLAKDVGYEILRYQKTRNIQTSLKSDQTLVTQADISADQKIRSSLMENFPKDGILSEEDNTIYPADKEYVWVVDPLDGTTNFSLGLHYWGVSIARLKNGSPDLAVLYFPLLDELITATKAGGAFLNDTQLQLKIHQPESPNTFFSCCSRTFRNYHVDIPYKPRILGSAAYGLCTVALGSAVLAFEVTPKVWDFSGSWLVVREAGGFISPLDGNSPFPLTPGTDYKSIKYPMLAAITQVKWDRTKTKINKK